MNLLICLWSHGQNVVKHRCECKTCSFCLPHTSILLELSEILTSGAQAAFYRTRIPQGIPKRQWATLIVNPASISSGVQIMKESVRCHCWPEGPAQAAASLSGRTLDALLPFPWLYC